MNVYSLEASLAERSRKKSPMLDALVSRKTSPVAPLSPQARARGFRVQPVTKKGLDSIRSEHRSFLIQLQERSFTDSCVRLFRRTELYVRRLKRLFGRIMPSLTPHKMLYGSIMGGIAFGMVSMAFISHSFGSGVFASSQAPLPETITHTEDQAVVAFTAPPESYDPGQDVFFEYFGQVTKEKYEENIRAMVKGYPIEEMLPYIFAQDRLTAAFLVGIAKKESNWGKRIPVLDGQDCFNYWGYRGIRRMMGTGGHTCFNSRKDAVETVAARLERLTQSEKLDTPEKMIVWKCGFSCQGHSRESVKKWISDVDMYFSQLSDE